MFVNLAEKNANFPSHFSWDQLCLASWFYYDCFEKSCEYAKDVYAYFIDFEIAYDQIPREKSAECYDTTVKRKV